MRLEGADPIRWLLDREVVTVRRADPLRWAAEVLFAESVGVVVVMDPDGLAGVLSERDIVRALAEGGDPDVERVVDLMTDDVLTVDVTEPVSAVAARMLANEIRHVVVTSDDGDDVEGVVSVRDVLTILLHETREAIGGEPQEVVA